MFRVKIRLADEERLVETIETMRAWLIDRQFTPTKFGYSLASASTLFQIDFAMEAEAAAFARAFGGVVATDGQF